MAAKQTKQKKYKDFKDSDTWFEVFRIGTHKDSSGNEKTWTEEDLVKIASTYNTSEHDAPVCIGHPKDNSPAYGWVKKNLKREGPCLLAQFRDVTPEFIDMVNNKHFPKRSISVYGDKTLRHIGFLGAMPPAIKGLKDAMFEEEEGKEIIIFDFECEFKEDGGIEMDPKEKEIQELKAAIANFMEQMKTKDKEIQDLKTREMSSEFAEKQKQKDEELKQLKLQLAHVEKEKRQAEYKEFCEKNKTRVTPAMKPFVMDALEIFHNKGEYQFSEGTEKNAVSKFKSFLESLPEQVSFRETATKDKVAKEADFSEDTDEVDYSEFGEVDDERLNLHKKVKEYASKNKVSYKEALGKVRGRK